ncbi:MAG: flagellin [Candidatus Auribacterota bacterium]|nr:flagellin [Candidatus Auribacterota bacterium]
MTGSSSDISSSISNLDTAYNLILKDESKLGSYIKRLGYEKDLLEIEQTNYESSRSVLQDADAVQTELEILRLTMVQNSTMSLLAQANSYYQTVLSLVIGSSPYSS